ncbi:MAG: ABC transporter substrate-binding protein [Methylobacter sp.]|nr:ABC transporter substrate-binding protein [Methylobacter sp.]
MMRNRNNRLVILGFLWAILLGLMPAAKSAAENLQAPQQVIQNVSMELQKKLKDKAFTQDFAQVTRFVNDVISLHIDFDKIAPLVLGKNWKTASAEEQQRFKQEFQTLIVRTYSRAFIEYNDWTLGFPPLEMSNEATKVIVKTQILQPARQPVEVTYRMFLGNGEWKVYDILIDGVSLVTNYRSTFSQEIQNKGSLSAVIDGLVKRNAEALSAKGSQ